MFLALKHFLKILLRAFLVPGRLHSLFVLKHAHIKNDVVIVFNRGKGGVWKDAERANGPACILLHSISGLQANIWLRALNLVF